MTDPDYERLAHRKARRREQMARVHRRRRVAALALLAGLATLIAIAVSSFAGGSGGSGGGSSASGGGGGGEQGKPGQPGGDPISLTVEVNGDLLIHGPVFQRALALGGGKTYDFAPMLTQIKPIVKGADLAICHVETPFSPDPPQGYPVFKTPPALAKAIKSTGWRACDTASNHTLDGGQEGIDFTLRTLDQQGIKHAGSYSSAASRRRPLIMNVRGAKVAEIACTQMTNGIPKPNPWSVNICDAPLMIALARQARRAGAQVVIANLHWGDEFVAQPSAFQQKLAQKLTRSKAITAVVGQHIHIVQPIKRVNNKIVVYGEGNLLSNQTAACCPAASQDGIMAVLTIRVKDGKAKLRKVRYYPVFVRHPDFVVQPVGRALRSGAANADELRASYDRTVQVAGRGPGIRPDPPRLPR